MAGIEQPSHVGRGHARLQLKSHTHAVGNGSNRPQRHTAEPSGLDPGDRRLIDPARRFHIRLPPTLLETRSPNQAPDSAIIHAPMIRMTAYQPLTDA